MKIYSLLFLALSSFCINSCEEPEESIVNSGSNKNTQKTTSVTQRSPVIPKQVKIAPPMKKLEENSAKNTKPSQLETNKNSENDVQDQQALDLSLPFEIKETTSSTITKKRAYLPDLFTKKKNPIKKPLQIDGTIIKRDEEQADKDRAVDGVGIDFKLTH